MSLCLATPAVAVTLALQGFTLSWAHSVERTDWRERWRVDGSTLVLEEARVRGSGAGMEPPEGSVLQQGWWVYHPGLRVPALHLAVSGATGDGWQLCTKGECRDLERLLTHDGRAPASIEIRPDSERPCLRTDAPR
jgi:hypothetical protein